MLSADRSCLRFQEDETCSKLNVLSFGTREANEQLRDALLLQSGSTLFAVNDYNKGPCSLRAVEPCPAAVIHLCATVQDWCREAEFIRRKYPRGAIIIVDSDPEALDDPLYDERVTPATGKSLLVNTIEQMVERRSRWEVSSA